MSKVIAIANQKGGVGKTTTAASLGIGLSKINKKVLLIDFDAQSDLTKSFGLEPDEIDNTIPKIIENKINDYKYVIEKEKYIVEVEGVHLLPCDIRLSGTEMKMINAMNREHLLKSIIKELKSHYDYIIIDCSPSLGQLTINALTAADSVIIPVQAQYLSMKGMELLLETIMGVKELTNSELYIEGILVTMFDKRTSLSREVLEALQQEYSNKIKIFKNVIGISTKIAEAPSQGLSIFKYSPNSEVAKAYELLANEVECNG